MVSGPPIQLNLSEPVSTHESGASALNNEQLELPCPPFVANDYIAASSTGIGSPEETKSPRPLPGHSP